MRQKPTTRRPIVPTPNAPAEPAAPEAAEPAKNQWGIKTEHVKTIDGVTYRTVLYGAEQGFDYLPMFGALASGPVGVALETVGLILDAGGDLTAARVTGSSVAEALHNACAVVVEVGGASKIREMLDHTTVKHLSGPGWSKADEVFDDLFAGRYWHLVRVLAWVLEVNYDPFGGGLLAEIWSRWTQINERLATGLSEPQPS